jgi:hypothetical protein
VGAAVRVISVLDAEFQTLEDHSKDKNQSEQFIGGQKCNEKKKKTKEGKRKEKERKEQYEGECDE